MKKKSLLLVIPLLIILLAVHFYKNKSNLSPTNTRTTFIKSKNSVTSHPTTKKEMAAMRFDSDTSSKTKTKDRIPASIKKKTLYGRRLIGTKIPKMKTKIKFENEINSKWKTFLGNELMRFQPPETKAFVLHQQGLIRIKNGKGKYIEEVIITFLTPTGKKNSFKAFVDSENGRVLKTWNKTIHQIRDSFIMKPN